MKTLFNPKRLPLTAQTAKIHGVETAFWEAGNRLAAPIILLHGFGGSHHGLLPLAQRLNDYHLILPDLPGHGASAIPPSATVEATAKWFEAFIKFVHIAYGRKPFIIAHSFGSQVAFDACRHVRREYAGCLLLTPVPHMSVVPYTISKTFKTVVPNRLTARLGRNQRFRFWRDWLLVVRRKQEVSKLMRWISASAALTPDKMAFAVTIGREVIDKLAYNEAIVKGGRFYCISADQDALVDAAGRAYLKRIFGEKHFWVCKHTGHLMPIEAPDETAHLVRSVLGKHFKP